MYLGTETIMLRNLCKHLTDRRPGILLCFIYVNTYTLV